MAGVGRLKPAIIVAVSVAGGAYAFALSAALPEALRGNYFFDFWFQGDTPRIVENLTDPSSNYYRISLHPVFAALFLPVGLALKQIGASAWDAARIVTALGAAAMTGLFLTVSRQIAGRWLDAGLATLVLLGSSAFMFWAGTPETYVWGGASILAVLAVLGAAKGAPPNLIAFTLASAASLGFTITNWMAALLGAALAYPWRRAGLVSALAFAAVAALAVVSVNLVQTPHPFIWLHEEASYVHRWLSDVIRAVPAFLTWSVVAPEPSTVQPPRSAELVDALLSFQRPELSRIGVLGAAAGLAWMLAFGLGVAALLVRLGGPILEDLRRRPLAATLRGPIFVALWRSLVADRLAATLVLAASAQFALHLVYGEETFLYALHFAPLLILIALYGAAAAPAVRPIALSLLALTAVLGGATNWSRFDAAIAIAHEAVDGNERANVTNARFARPDDFWPRNEGHVALGVGLDERAKAYVEPGGEFSPSVGSFGVSIWVRDAHGAVVRASGTTPIDQVRSRLLADGTGLSAETPDYLVTWRSSEPGRWEMELATAKDASVAIRSVGPAGAPITSIRRDGDDLIVSERWRVAAQGLALEAMGVEGPGWLSPAGDPPASVEDPAGWCFALLRRDDDAPATVTLSITDMSAADRDAGVAASYARNVASGLSLSLPDPRFQESIDSQVAQILHGLVGDQLRPGEPINYPLAWQRDAAVQVVALVRAGRADAARVLVRHVAESDYFGGFGAETDAPGLALWAIGETSRALNDPAFDAAMAEHVRRKAEEILAFMHAEEEIRREHEGPLAPVAAGLEVGVVARPSDDGLIHGSMDWHDPYLSLTAISVHGLEEAARMATDANDAERWESAAATLRQAWRERAGESDIDNPRTLMMGLEPSFVAAGAPEFAEALERSWRQTRDEAGGYLERPLWPYFELGQMRQQLMLGRPDRAWATLEYFWTETPHPGLYTLWESDREEGGFRLWRGVRGWSNPPHVTPHYWASAELILLQTAMLAYVDRTTGQEAIVIGGGVLESWLDQPMDARGLVTERGRVDWSWSDGVMRVRAPAGAAIRLGSAFPADAQIVVETQ